jgi:hypothetical protein
MRVKYRRDPRVADAVAAGEPRIPHEEASGTGYRVGAAAIEAGSSSPWTARTVLDPGVVEVEDYRIAHVGPGHARTPSPRGSRAHRRPGPSTRTAT